MSLAERMKKANWYYEFEDVHRDWRKGADEVTGIVKELAQFEVLGILNHIEVLKLIDLFVPTTEKENICHRITLESKTYQEQILKKQ